MPGKNYRSRTSCCADMIDSRVQIPYVGIEPIDVPFLRIGQQSARSSLTAMIVDAEGNWQMREIAAHFEIFFNKLRSS